MSDTRDRDSGGLLTAMKVSRILRPFPRRVFRQGDPLFLPANAKKQGEA